MGHGHASSPLTRRCVSSDLGRCAAGRYAWQRMTSASYLQRDAAAVDGQRRVDAGERVVRTDGGAVSLATRHLYRLDAGVRLERNGAADVQHAGLHQSDIAHRHSAYIAHAAHPTNGFNMS